MSIQLERLNASNTNRDLANTDLGDSQDTQDEEDGKTRKKSDKNMNNYRKIVIADSSEATQKYTSEYRGKVQDRNVNIKMEPLYSLTYYEKENEVKRIIHFHRYIDELNNSKVLPKRLLITNNEAPLAEEQVAFHFALVDKHTADIVSDPENALKHFARAMDFYLVQDFASSLDDLNNSIIQDDDFYPAYFMRSVVKYKQLEYQRAEEVTISVAPGNTVTKEIKAIDYEMVRNDLNKVISIAPDFMYAYYNRGILLAMLKDYRAAIVDFDKAIEMNEDFAEAYFNRGLTHIFLGNNRKGISDLSKAGELGIYSAYNIIKRFTEMPE